MKSPIEIMTSLFAAEALKPNSPKVQELEDFLYFMIQSEKHAEKRHFLCDSTAEGLRVSITSTLELMKYVTSELGYSYVMTSHLSQDKIENWFGIVRQSSGCMRIPPHSNY